MQISYQNKDKQVKYLRVFAKDTIFKVKQYINWKEGVDVDIFFPAGTKLDDDDKTVRDYKITANAQIGVGALSTANSLRWIYADDFLLCSLDHC
jgi:hypothetical protein